MQYYTTKPKLIKTTNRGNQIYASCSYPEKSNPADLIKILGVLDYIKVYPHWLCEFYGRHFERVNKVEKAMRGKLKDPIPEWKNDYKN